MDDPAYQARVDLLRAEAGRMGVTGIPTFFIGDAVVVGCQPFEVLAAAVRRAGARPKT
jgi:protein-disulfide isomerase